jgi:hypothetical protein
MVAFMFSILALTLGSQATSAASCGTASLATYATAGFSCTIGDKTFSNFAYQLSPITGQPTAANITVSPDITAPPGSEGLTFSGNWSISGVSQSLDSLITFTVANSAGLATIKDASFITLAGSLITGTGLLTVTEGLCLGGNPCPGGSTFIGNAADASTKILLQAQTTFTPTGLLNASKDILLTTGSPTGGSVFLTSITDDFSQVPEPGSLALLGTGLLSLGGLLRRRVLRA